MKSPTGAREWSDHSYNLQVGCEHNCGYCFAKSMAIRFKRATVDSWRHPVTTGRRISKHYARSGVTMFPTTHDITMRNHEECRTALLAMLASGRRVLVVSKANPDPLGCVLAGLSKSEFGGMIEVRVTIGSMDDSVLKAWEPGAPSFGSRMRALAWACSEGFNTSVSIEPFLDSDTVPLFHAVRPFVTQGVWIGRPNKLMERVRRNTGGNKQSLMMAEHLAMMAPGWASFIYAALRGHPDVRWKDSMRYLEGGK